MATPFDILVLLSRIPQGELHSATATLRNIVDFLENSTTREIDEWRAAISAAAAARAPAEDAPATTAKRAHRLARKLDSINEEQMKKFGEISEARREGLPSQAIQADLRLLCIQGQNIADKMDELGAE